MLFRNFYPCATCGYEGFMRPGSGRRSDRAARSRRSARTNRELQVDHSSLAVCGPDARRLAIDRAPAARTVADVEAANAKVKERVLQAQSVTSELVRLHAVKITACENVDASHLDATAAKATAFLRLSSELNTRLRNRFRRCARSWPPNDQPRPGRKMMRTRLRSQRTNLVSSICSPRRWRKRSRA
jgi:hypothetical protein